MTTRASCAFDREIVRQSLAVAPRRFSLTPRNPARRIDVGDDHLNFSLVAGPPFVHDSVQGRRGGNMADYERLIRLAESFDVIHYIGNQPDGAARTAGRDPPSRLLPRQHRQQRQGVPLRRDRCRAALDGIAMMAIARGISREEMMASPGVLTIISVNSPRRFDEAMTDGLVAMAECGQAVCVTPFTLMGAMTPVTITAALIQRNAEALAGLTLRSAGAAQACRALWRLHLGMWTSARALRPSERRKTSLPPSPPDDGAPLWLPIGQAIPMPPMPSMPTPPMNRMDAALGRR